MLVGGVVLFIINSKEFIGTGLGFVAGSLFLLLTVVIVVGLVLGYLGGRKSIVKEKEDNYLSVIGENLKQVLTNGQLVRVVERNPLVEGFEVDGIYYGMYYGNLIMGSLVVDKRAKLKILEVTEDNIQYKIKSNLQEITYVVGIKESIGRSVEVSEKTIEI